jgi:hypothetical protein
MPRWERDWESNMTLRSKAQADVPGMLPVMLWRHASVCEERWKRRRWVSGGELGCATWRRSIPWGWGPAGNRRPGGPAQANTGTAGRWRWPDPQDLHIPVSSHGDHGDVTPSTALRPLLPSIVLPLVVVGWQRRPGVCPFTARRRLANARSPRLPVRVVRTSDAQSFATKPQRLAIPCPRRP